MPADTPSGTILQSDDTQQQREIFKDPSKKRRAIHAKDLINRLSQNSRMGQHEYHVYTPRTAAMRAIRTTGSAAALILIGYSLDSSHRRKIRRRIRRTMRKF